MAMHYMMDCMQCETEMARHGSHFCSPECMQKFGESVDGPLTCDHCDAEAETVAEAEVVGWVEIYQDLEGSWWNYRGLCPECQCDEAVVVVEAAK